MRQFYCTSVNPWSHDKADPKVDMIVHTNTEDVSSATEHCDVCGREMLITTHRCNVCGTEWKSEIQI